jgi:hypothetical protein
VKVLVAVIMVALVLGGAAYAQSRQAPSPTLGQFKALQVRVTKLESQNVTLKKGVTALLNYTTGCLGQFVGMTQYGDVANNDGYHYLSAAAGGEVLTTGLDITVTGQTAEYQIATVPSGCELTADSTTGTTLRALLHH